MNQNCTTPPLSRLYFLNKIQIDINNFFIYIKLKKKNKP